MSMHIIEFLCCNKCWEISNFQWKADCGVCRSGVREQIGLFMSIVPCNLNHIICTNLPKITWLVDLLDWLAGWASSQIVENVAAESESHPHLNVITQCGSMCIRMWIDAKDRLSHTHTHVRLQTSLGILRNYTELMTCKEHIYSAMPSRIGVSTCIYIITLNYFGICNAWTLARLVHGSHMFAMHLNGAHWKERKKDVVLQAIELRVGNNIWCDFDLM